MTRYEQINDINERFIVTYGQNKVRYLRDNGFYFLFTGYNTSSHGQFWVYDSTPEIKKALDDYATSILKMKENHVLSGT